MRKRQFKKYLKTIDDFQLNEIVAYETNHVRRYLAEIEWGKRYDNLPKSEGDFLDDELLDVFK